MDTNEQRMKLAEEIRRELSKGNYQMDVGELPCSGTANRISAVLWECGWRPEEAKSTMWDNLRAEQDVLWAHLWGIRNSIEGDLACVEKLHWDNESMKEGYISGLKTAMTNVSRHISETERRRNAWEAKLNEALEEEGYNE